MFTGIVKSCSPVVQLRAKTGLTEFTIKLPFQLVAGLQPGASMAVDGVCLTVVGVSGHLARFQVMQETLSRTTLGGMAVSQKVNVEPSATFNDEIGGHIVSGHVACVAEIVRVDEPENNHVVHFQVDEPQLMKYILPKGFVALDGTSLTVAERVLEKGQFSVWFVPETLKRTTFGFKREGDRVNLEIDSMTQAVVDTVVTLMGSVLQPHGRCRGGRY